MLNNAGVAKLVDASALGADGRKTVKVRVLSPAPVETFSKTTGLGDFCPAKIAPC